MHGVVPHIKNSDETTDADAPRVTLMIGWWGSHVTTSASPSIQHDSRTKKPTLTNLQPNMAMPQSKKDESVPVSGSKGDRKKRPASDSQLSWPSLFEVDSTITDVLSMPRPKNDIITHPSNELIEVIGDIWEEVSEKVESGPQEKIECDFEFLGNWFVKSRSEVLDAVEHTAELCSHAIDDGAGELPGQNTDAGAVGWISAEELKLLRGE